MRHLTRPRPPRSPTRPRQLRHLTRPSPPCRLTRPRQLRRPTRPSPPHRLTRPRQLRRPTRQRQLHRLTRPSPPRCPLVRDSCTASLVQARRAARSSETAAPPHSSKPAVLPARPRQLHRLTRPSPPRCPLVRDICTASLVRARHAAHSSETAAPPHSSKPAALPARPRQLRRLTRPCSPRRSTRPRPQPHSSPRQLRRFTHTRQLRRPTHLRKICNTCNRLFAVTACIMRTSVAIDTTRFRLTKKSELKLRRNKHVRESSDYMQHRS